MSFSQLDEHWKGTLTTKSEQSLGAITTFIGPSNQAVQFYEFQSHSYRKAVDNWTIVGLRNKVVKDIRKMIGKMIWDAREEAVHLEEN
jgi:hypothetical protein